MSESLKPFNLERAKAGDPVYDMHLKEAVHFIGVNRLGEYVIQGCGVLYYTRWADDLRMAPKKRNVWLNINLDYSTDGYIYNTEDEANRYAGSSRIGNKAWPLEIEEQAMKDKLDLIIEALEQSCKMYATDPHAYSYHTCCGVEFGSGHHPGCKLPQALEAARALRDMKPVCEISRNEAGQIFMHDGSGNAFRMDKHIGTKLYALDMKPFVTC